MSSAEILAELPRLTPEELDVIRLKLTVAGDPREVAGTGVRPAGYESLFGCLAHDPAFEIPERHSWRPAPQFD